MQIKTLTQPFLAACLACLATLPLTAQNPIIYDRYTPDPAPYVHGDTLYLFVDHDEDETQNNYFTMKDWLLYSTVDMVNWMYRGTPLTSATFSASGQKDKKQARPPFDTNSGREESHSIVTYLNISCANSWRLRRQVCHSWAVSGET